MNDPDIPLGTGVTQNHSAPQQDIKTPPPRKLIPHEVLFKLTRDKQKHAKH